jgi:hypothetical protein
MSDEKLAQVVSNMIEERDEFEKLEKLIPLGEPKFGQWPTKRKRPNRRQQIEQLVLRKAEGE